MNCGHCGMYHSGPCPKIKALEYYPDGTLKRVEYHSAVPAAFPPMTKAGEAMVWPSTTAVR